MLSSFYRYTKAFQFWTFGFNNFNFAFSVDNSDYMRNGDFIPSRMQAQQDAINLVCHSKTRSNPENNVGLISLAKYVNFGSRTFHYFFWLWDSFFSRLLTYLPKQTFIEILSYLLTFNFYRQILETLAPAMYNVDH